MQQRHGHSREDDISRLEAFEMWIWRKMEKISWRDHKTNIMQVLLERALVSRPEVGMVFYLFYTPVDKVNNNGGSHRRVFLRKT